MGNVELDGSIGGVTAAYGVIGYDDNSAITFLQRQGSRGVVYPTQPYPVHRSEATTITSGTFTVLWGGQLNRPSLDVLYFQMAVQTDATTTGDIEIVDDVTNANTTATLTIPPGTSGFATFRWLHSSTVGLYDNTGGSPILAVSIQARRSAGAGTFTVFHPGTSELTSSFLFPDAATNGNPQLL